MARIAGVDLPNGKRVDIALTSIYGIGRVTARQLVEKARINPTTKAGELSSEDINALREVIDFNLLGRGWTVVAMYRSQLNASSISDATGSAAPQGSTCTRSALENERTYPPKVREKLLRTRRSRSRT